MAKFDYKKWVTENKHGKIKELFEQFATGSATGSGCPSGTQLNTQLCPDGVTNQFGNTIENCCTGSITSPTGSVSQSFCCNLDAINFGKQANGDDFPNAEEYLMYNGPQGDACDNSICQGSVSTGPEPKGRSSIMKRSQRRTPKGMNRRGMKGKINEQEGTTCYVCVSSSQVVDNLNNNGGLQQNGSAIVLGMNEFPVSIDTYNPQCTTLYSDIVAGGAAGGNGFGGFLTLDMSALPDWAYNTPNSEVCFEQSTTSTPGGASVNVDNPPDSYLGTGDPNNPVQSDFDFNTDCTNFNALPTNFQSAICDSCDNGQINMQCECCSETGGMPGSQGITPPQSATKSLSQKLSQKKKIKPTKNPFSLKEMKDAIKKLTLKKHKR